MDSDQVRNGHWPRFGWALPPLGLVAWAAAMTGTRVVIRGGDPVVIYGPTGDEALRAIGLVVLAIVVALLLLRDRPWANVGAWAIGTVVAAVASAPTAGRAFGAFAAISAGASVAVFVGFRAWPTMPPRHQRIVLAALAPFTLAQWAWTRQVSWAAGAGILATLAVVAAYHLEAERITAWHGAARTATLAAARRAWRTIATVAHQLAEVARRTAARPATWPLVVAVTGSALLALPVIHRYAFSPSRDLVSDYNIHLFHASRTTIVPFRLTTPFAYPGFHLSTALLRPVFGGVEGAATFLLVVAVGAAAVVLTWTGSIRFADREPIGWWAGSAFALATIFIETPLIIEQALRLGNPYDWAAVDHVFNSPTDLLVLPLALLQLLVLARAIRSDHLQRRSGLALAVLSVAAMVAKPSLAMVLVGALPLVVLLARRLSAALVRYLLAWFYVPTAMVVAWQIWYLGAKEAGPDTVGIGIDPMATIRIVSLDRITPLFLLPEVVTIGLCVWAAGRRYLREPAIALALWSLLLSLVPLFLLAETGKRAGDATFAKPATICWVLLNLLSWRFLAGEAVTWRRGRADGAAAPPWLLAVTAFLALCLVAGAISYLDAVGITTLPIRRTGA